MTEPAKRSICKDCNRHFNTNWPHVVGNYASNVFSTDQCRKCYVKKIDEMIKKVDKLIEST